jgi:hypothetical protein
LIEETAFIFQTPQSPSIQQQLFPPSSAAEPASLLQTQVGIVWFRLGYALFVRQTTAILVRDC